MSIWKKTQPQKLEDKRYISIPFVNDIWNGKLNNRIVNGYGNKNMKAVTYTTKKLSVPSYVLLVYTTGHSINFDTVKILMRSDDRYSRVIVELIHIHDRNTMEGNQADYQLKLRTGVT
ncbi:hypothetical protein ACOME3_005040 [Neoechinorhynchus agilis]